jgi:hypothetical protein
MVEGTYMPFFGFACRLDKVQFGDIGDHTRYAVEHAQHVANLIVDEARLSTNIFEWTNDEQKALINNYDVKSVSLPG